MKKISLFLLLIFSLGLHAQQVANNDPNEKLTPTISKMKSIASHFSVVASLGTSPVAPQNLSTVNGKQLFKVTLSELSINYKPNSRLSFGLTSIGALGNCNPGYFTGEGTYVSLGDDDDHDESNDDDDDMDDLEDLEDLEEDCEADELNNLLGNINYKVSNKIPLYIQTAIGYSFSGKAPAYSASLAYHQKLLAGISLRGAIRYSDVLYKIPADAIPSTVSPTDGLKAELGLGWNF